ncbi:uncharacterized protein LOC128215884 [Mya arenaria]|uniref:uncharacterized protein LOC128215884 n=1 Tax=Mya arenaria TaxID=6604 RepID=UPI0022E41B54|nr:uncharacterized protein LOC128215884 [Mya arenaria]
MFPDRQKAGLCADCPSSCFGGECDPVNGSLQNISKSDKWGAKTYLLVAGVPIASVILGIVTPLVFSYIKKKRKQYIPSLYRTRRSTDVSNVGEINSDANADIIEDETCRYTCLENSDTTKDITPVSVYMTVPLVEGISCNATFDDSMTTYERLSENEVQDDLNRSQISTMNGEYLTVVHEWPSEPNTHHIRGTQGLFCNNKAKQV